MRFIDGHRLVALTGGRGACTAMMLERSYFRKAGPGGCFSLDICLIIIVLIFKRNNYTFYFKQYRGILIQQSTVLNNR